ncbi:MAG TPA: alkaline phosphatase family protein [Burkholderiales bacterium]|nr:alkaline phosphatase family protein [Burkholderiales bacterium]
MKMKTQLLAAAIALAGAAQAQADVQFGDGRKDDDHRAGKVFVIAMENHNWTQPGTQASPQQIFRNPAAPFVNGLVNGTSGISDQVSFANAYLNAAAGDHPSEPNYIWAEAGANFGVNNDDNPYHADCSPDTVQATDQHLSAFLTAARKSWRSYQEDTDVDATNTPLPMSAWTVPLFSTSGVYAAPGVNAYNYSNQFNYAAKHNPMVYFTDTSGGCDTSASNPMRLHYAPLQQLALDLARNTVADYSWITPNQFNDQHTTLAGGYGQYPNSGSTADSARIAQGDNFLARIVPLIMASDAYKDHGIIVLWWDESEGGDDPSRTLPFMIISKDAHRNVDGKPYSNTIQYSHSSFVRTMQEIFDVDPRHGYPWLGDANNATDLSDLFERGAIR